MDWWRIAELLSPIIVVILGSTWYAEIRKERRETKRKTLTKEDLSQAVEESLQASDTIASLRKDVQQLGDLQEESYAWHRHHQEETDEYKRLTLRQELFRHPTDRLTHEHQLECGAQYLALGGNGVGHLRLDQLRASYKYRLAHDDWDYTHTPVIVDDTTPVSDK